ncbi:MAG: sodium/proton-translocating pyrophosphatase, partial [Flavobacteriales bacterium]
RGEAVREIARMHVFYAIVLGLVVGFLMSYITEYYTAMGRKPVMSIVKKSGTGHATNVIGGLAVGMESTFLPILVLAAGIFGAFQLAGLYGVAIAAAGMMATTAMQLAIDAFGPIADNAGGIAEMSGLPSEVRGRTDILDATGNTTAATGKGFAIASAALTALALFAAYVGLAGITAIDIYKADVLAMLFVGGMIPFLFSSMAISAVGKAARDMVREVRRQFREIPGIMEGKGKPEYEKCVAISTQASIREMILPGALALLSPVIVGFLFGPEALGGLLAGITVSGVLMGIFQNNAGGAWDNAKKSFEKGVEIDGVTWYKHKADKPSPPHQAAVTGDTVGDPFKDTSGPSMNILIKLTSIVALIIAPHINESGHPAAGHGQQGQASQAETQAASAAAGEASARIATKREELMATINPRSTEFTHTLITGKEVSGAMEGMEHDLMTFIMRAIPADKTTWIGMNEVTYFNQGDLDPKASAAQLDNLAEIMRAYPTLKLEIGATAKDIENAELETRLKTARIRAESIVKALNDRGIALERLSAKGFGDDAPFLTKPLFLDRPPTKGAVLRVSDR